MLAVTGFGSTIVQTLFRMLPRDECAVRFVAGDGEVPMVDRYVFAAGLLIGKPAAEKTGAERRQTWLVNDIWPVLAIEEIIETNDRARICVIGSESAFTGSYDEDYAESKKALHTYVETKVLRTPDQQLVCVSPTIISDAGMTNRRTDTERLSERAAANPKRRHLTSAEVAAMIHHLLYVDQGFTTGVVIRMNGGPRG